MYLCVSYQGRSYKMIVCHAKTYLNVLAVTSDDTTKIKREYVKQITGSSLKDILKNKLNGLDYKIHKD